MKIWTIAAQKGGSSKTTLSLNLAAAAQKFEISAVVLDVDPQASASKLNDIRIALQLPDLSVVTTPVSRLPVVLGQLKAEPPTLVIIDTPPFSDTVTGEAIKVATQVIIPTNDDLVEVLALPPTFSLARIYKPQMRPVVVLTRTNPPRPPKAAKPGDKPKRVGPAIDPLEPIKMQARSAGIEIDICPTRMSRRSTYPQAPGLGKMAVEMSQAAHFEAKREIEKIFEFLAARDGLEIPKEG
jgi:cellulose biosynthesis protein BcsQ